MSHFIRVLQLINLSTIFLLSDEVGRMSNNNGGVQIRGVHILHHAVVSIIQFLLIHFDVLHVGVGGVKRGEDEGREGVVRSAALQIAGVDNSCDSLYDSLVTAYLEWTYPLFLKQPFSIWG